MDDVETMHIGESIDNFYQLHNSTRAPKEITVIMTYKFDAVQFEVFLKFKIFDDVTLLHPLGNKA